MRPSDLIGTRLPGLPWRITGYRVAARELTLTLAPMGADERPHDKDDCVCMFCRAWEKRHARWEDALAADVPAIPDTFDEESWPWP